MAKINFSNLTNNNQNIDQNHPAPQAESFDITHERFVEENDQSFHKNAFFKVKNQKNIS